MKTEIEFIDGLLNYLHITPEGEVDLTKDDVECITEALELLKEHYKEVHKIGI